jgi:pantetheine-phosphate adenylyltransferase
VRRAAKLFDKVIVGVADSAAKQPFFATSERVAMTREVVAGFPNVDVKPFSGLLMDFVNEQGAASSCGVCARCPTSNTSSRWRE